MLQSREKGTARKDTAMTKLILRISFFTILLLTGCENRQVANPAVGQIQQIESPLQNTLDGMAKAKAPELERGRSGNLAHADPSK
jgi:hypothetical protein